MKFVLKDKDINRNDSRLFSYVGHSVLKYIIQNLIKNGRDECKLK